jgi:nuclear receptor coactivator 2
LIQLLNETSDDGDLEARAGLKKQNELLQQLLKDSDETERSNPVANSQDDSLLKSLGFAASSPPPSQECGTVGSGRKRPSLESEDGGGGKRLQQAINHPGSQIPQPGMSTSQAPSQVI